MTTENTQYELLRLLEQNPGMSQRELAREIGFSLGKTNYCVKALIEKGWIKASRFRNSQNKIAYLYQLTPAGVGAKVRVTRRFLKRKIKEHDDIAIEIERLRHEVAQADSQGDSLFGER